jgi:hypothetical protein
MININLIPPHLRQRRKSKLLGRLNIPLEIIIGCSAGLLMFLALIHILLLLLNVRKLAYHQILKGKWEAMVPDKENVDSVINEMRAVQGKYKAIEEIVTKGGVSWAQKLNLLSDNLPRGMWFDKLVLDDEMLLVEGSAISRDTNEIINVHRLTVGLKENEEFMRDFVDLELGSIQRRKIKNVEIADFVITMRLK